MSLPELTNLKVLAKVGDSITTDHISPAGSIPLKSSAGKYLTAHNIQGKDFNSYGSRRGNHHVMVRGTLANTRLNNEISQGNIGGYTTYWPTNEVTTIFSASEKYLASNTGLVILAGKDYGMGSSRDWAAKGVNLLGVKAIIAESFERIHRSNLVMMGLVPLQYKEGENAEVLGLTGEETFEIKHPKSFMPKQEVEVIARNNQGEKIQFTTILRYDTSIETTYYPVGGILNKILEEKRILIGTNI